MDFLNALILFANFVFVPGLAYGAQLALGALGITLIPALTTRYIADPDNQDGHLLLKSVKT